jgi:AraC family L-rhamnose operon regulatory protein RhaS
MGLFYRNQPFVFGETTYRTGGSFGPVPSDAINLMVVTSGAMEVAWDGKRARVPAGRAALFFSHASIEFTFPAGTSTEVQWCETGEPAGSVWVRQRLDLAPPVLEATGTIRQLMAMGLGLALEARDEVCALRDALGEALICAYLHQANLDRDDAVIPEPVNRGKRFIEAHFGEPIDNAEIARSAGVSPQNLTRLFKGTIGVSPTQHMWNLRAEKGAFLLRQTGMTVSEIAYQCGYKNPFHFSRHVKTKFGRSPSDLRNLKRPLQPSLQRTQVPDVHFGA